MKYRSTARFAREGVEGAAVALGTLLTWPVSKRWLRNWGSSSKDRRAGWPGDDLVAPNLPTNTRAIDIQAPAEAVWPWLVQFGLGKAGFYSYELLERLIGIPVTNVESVESTMQSLEEGDKVSLHPTAPGIPVAIVEPQRCICFGTKTPDPEEDLRRSWSFYIAPKGDKACRLLLRGCFEETRKRSLKSRLAFALAEPIDFAMEQRMLRTIKRLSEETPLGEEVRLGSEREPNQVQEVGEQHR